MCSCQCVSNKRTNSLVIFFSCSFLFYLLPNVHFFLSLVNSSLSSYTLFLSHFFLPSLSPPPPLQDPSYSNSSSYSVSLSPSPSLCITRGTEDESGKAISWVRRRRRKGGKGKKKKDDEKEKEEALVFHVCIYLHIYICMHVCVSLPTLPL